MEDVLGQLDLVGLQRLVGAAEALGVKVALDQRRLFPGDPGLLFGLFRLPVCPGDFGLEQAVVPLQPARPGGHSPDGRQAHDHGNGQKRGVSRPAAGQAVRPLPRRGRPAVDRLAGQEPLAGRRAGRPAEAVPPRRLLAQAFQADRLQVAGQARPQGPWGDRLGLEHQSQGARRRSRRGTAAGRSSTS